MTQPTSRAATLVAELAALVAVSLAPAIGSAQTCPTPSVLANSISQNASDPSFFSFTPTVPRWSAVGVRANDGFNWLLEGADATAPFPTCYSGLIGTSNVGAGIDFFAIDGRVRAPQTDYVGAHTAAFNGVSARVEFEQYDFAERANASWDRIFFGANDVVMVREVEMFANVQHTIQMNMSAGASGLRVFIFEPVTAGNGVVPRSGRVYEEALTAATNHGINFTPTVAGYHALVFKNEAASAGDFWLAIRRCPNSSSGMADNVPFFSSQLDEWPAFTPPAARWNAVGVRGEPGYSYNLDVAPGLRDAFGLFTLGCDDTILAAQTGGLGTRVIVGDFRANPLGIHSAHMGVEQSPTSNNSGYMEWENGLDVLTVNGDVLLVNPAAHNLLDLWSVPLVQGGTYTVTITPAQGATNSYTALLYANPSPGSPYWATRPDAVLATTNSANYVAPATGDYALVVVNDVPNGTGGYTIAVSSDLVGVLPGAGDGLTHIRAIAPNPSFAGARVEYALARAGRVGVRVTDVAGRLVAELDAGVRDAGEGAVVWNGRDASGARPPAGVYFMTLALDGRATDRAKMIVLR